MQNLAETINDLPSDMQQKVFDYIDELKRKKIKKGKKLSLNWAGGLKEYKDQFTSFELQKKSMDRWTS